MIRVFDITRPGRHCEERATSKTRKSKQGQRGIISCINFDPTNSGSYAAGSYSGSLYTYDESSGVRINVFKHGIKGRNKPGLTQVKFSPNGLYLFAGYRKCNYISCWDVRKPKTELTRFARVASTNQVCF